MCHLRLDAISLTMFGYKVTAPPPGRRSISTILEAFSSSEPMVEKDALLGALADTFPQLLKLPNPLKRAADELRTELGRIAREVWSGGPGSRLGDARLLDLIGTSVADLGALGVRTAVLDDNGKAMTEDQVIAQVSRSIVSSAHVANWHHPLRLSASCLPAPGPSPT
jgi:hypothetical protein